MASTVEERRPRGRRASRAKNDLVRVQVIAAAGDAKLIRGIARRLREPTPEAVALRRNLEQAVPTTEGMSILDAFGSDLPDEYFEGVFDQPRSVST